MFRGFFPPSCLRLKKVKQFFKKSDSAAASAASSLCTTSSFSKSVVSPLIPTTTVSEILVSQSLGTLGHFGVPRSVVAGVTDHFVFLVAPPEVWLGFL